MTNLRTSEADGSDRAAAHPDPSPSVAIGRGRILYAGDDTLLLRATTAALEALGFEVWSARDGAEFLARLASEKPDGLLLDIDMPDNRGLELLHALPAGHERIPAVLVTEHPSFDSAIGAVRLGVVDYIIQPVDTEELARSLDRAVHQSRVLASLDATLGLASELLKNVEVLRRVLQQQGVPSLLGDGGMLEPREPVDPLRNLLPEELAKLSPRERDVLRELAAGNSPKRVAKALQLSTNTIRNHMKGIYLKLGVNSQIALFGRLATPRR